MRLMCRAGTALLALLLVYLCDSTNASDVDVLLEWRSVMEVYPPSWDSDSSTFCTWAYIQCDSSQRIIAIDMYDNSAGAVELEGRLPDSLGQLTMLSSFSIRSNKFRGTIPPSMFLIPNITDLNFEKNELEGTLPATIANATRLKTFSVQSNYFYGPVPDSILASDELVRVNLASNGFGCPSPAFFQRLNQRTWTYCDFALNSFDNDGYSICNGLVPGYLSATPSRCFWTPQAPPQMNPPTSDPDYWFGNERVICKIYGRRPYFFALNSTGSPLNYEFQAFELQGIWERAVDSSFRMEEYQLHTYHHFDNPSPGVHRAFAKLNGTNTDFIVTFDLNTNGDGLVKFSIDVGPHAFNALSGSAMFNFAVSQTVRFNVATVSCTDDGATSLSCSDGSTNFTVSGGLQIMPCSGTQGALGAYVSYTVQSQDLIQRFSYVSWYSIDDQPCTMYENGGTFNYFIPYGRSDYLLKPNREFITSFDQGPATSVASLINFSARKWTSSFNFDPTMDFTILFDVDDDEAVSAVAIGVGVAAGVVGLALIAAVLLHPKVRTKIMPFFSRPVDHTQQQKVKLEEQSSPNWQVSRRGTDLHNTKEY